MWEFAAELSSEGEIRRGGWHNQRGVRVPRTVQSWHARAGMAGHQLVQDQAGLVEGQKARLPAHNHRRPSANSRSRGGQVPPPGNQKLHLFQVNIWTKFWTAKITKLRNFD